MLQNYIAGLIREELPFEPNKQQEELLELLGRFIVSTDGEKVFLLKGYAGTGKTSVVSALVRTLNNLKQKTVLLAPTGRAAKVLSGYSGSSAYTIHKKIYRQKSMSEFQFGLDRNLSPNTLFIVDEASMISNMSGDSSFGSGRLLDDLIEYVFSADGCSLLLLGDTAQLPPVMQLQSPALEADKLLGYGLNTTEFTLTMVARQALESGILHFATRLRESIEQNDVTHLPVFQFMQFADFKHTNGNDLIDEIQRSYSETGTEETMVITRSNKRANLYNNGIRARVLFRDEDLSNGDLLMITRNNYFWNKPYKEIDFIANGDIVEVIRKKRYYEMYGNHFVDLTLRSLDYGWEIDARIWLESLQSDSPAAMNEMTNQLFQAVVNDYPEIRSKKEIYKKVFENEYFNSLQVKFAYAVTCHKAQGGQWKRVFVDPGQMNEGQVDAEFYRWFYTAITRATEKIAIVNYQQNS